MVVVVYAFVFVFRFRFQRNFFISTLGVQVSIRVRRHVEGDDRRNMQAIKQKDYITNRGVYFRTARFVFGCNEPTHSLIRNRQTDRARIRSLVVGLES
jgi:hypothetical protein